MKNRNAARWLKVAFLIGMITDALALLPMIVPSIATLFWGFQDFSGIYYVAMGYGAALMLAWTLLLYWAYRKPVERRNIAPLTTLIITGFVITEIVALYNGYIQVEKLIPSFVSQAALLVLFIYAWVISHPKHSSTVSS